MSLLNIIFPFYFLLLTCLPCADNCKNEIQPILSSLSTNTIHTHNDTEKESCSPFCFCACCGIQINQLNLPQVCFQNCIFISNPNCSIYKFSFQTVFYNIWQPPQLS